MLTPIFIFLLYVPTNIMYVPYTQQYGDLWATEVYLQYKTQLAIPFNLYQIKRNQKIIYALYIVPDKVHNCSAKRYCWSCNKVRLTVVFLV